MKKYIILFVFLFSLFSPDFAMAERIEIPSQVSTDTNTKDSNGRDRAPMRIPLSICYDTDADC